MFFFSSSSTGRARDTEESEERCRGGTEANRLSPHQDTVRQRECGSPVLFSIFVYTEWGCGETLTCFLLHISMHLVGVCVCGGGGGARWGS